MLSVATRFGFDLQTGGTYPSLQVTKGGVTSTPCPDQDNFNGHVKPLMTKASEQAESISLTSDEEDSDCDETTMYENFDCDRLLSSRQPPDRIAHISDNCSKKNNSTDVDTCFDVSKFVNEGNKDRNQNNFCKGRCSKNLVRKHIPRDNTDEFNVGTTKRKSNTETVENKFVYDSSKILTADDIQKIQELDIESSYDRCDVMTSAGFSVPIKGASISYEESSTKLFRNTTINFDLSQLKHNMLDQYTYGRKPSDKQPWSNTRNRFDSSENDQLFKRNKRRKTETDYLRRDSYVCVDLIIKSSEVVCLISQNKKSDDTKEDKRETTTIERQNYEGEITNSGSTNNLVFNTDARNSSQTNHLAVSKHKRKQVEPHKCNQCFREFREKRKLREHLSIHTGEKPYMCYICGMNFRLPGNLSTPKRIKHSLEQKYSCKVCFKSYKTSHSLQLHMDTHNKTRFKCDACGKDYSVHITLITNTCLYNFDPLKPHCYIVKLGFTGVYIIFHISAQNIDCGYSLEPPRRGGSNEYPQSMF